MSGNSNKEMTLDEGHHMPASDYIMAEVALLPVGYCAARPAGDRGSLAESKGL